MRLLASSIEMTCLFYGRQWNSTIYSRVNAHLCGSASDAVGGSLVASGKSTERRAQEQGESEERLDDGHFGYW
jgi:hypothetical protein